MKRRLALALGFVWGVSLGCDRTEALVLGAARDGTEASGGSGGADAAGGSSGAGGNAGSHDAGSAGSHDSGSAGSGGSAGSSGGEGGSGGDMTCPRTCRDEAEAKRKECLASGMTEEECQIAFDRGLLSCLDACAQRCREACDTRTGDALDVCLKGDTQADSCVEAFVLDSASCRPGCGVPLDAECAKGCAPTSLRDFEACISAGATEAECGSKAKVIAPACLKECERDRCATECDAEAAEVFDACIKEGLPEADCAERRKVAQDRCLVECQDPAACAATCERTAEDAYQTCIASGEDPTLCKEKREATLRTCLGECSADGGIDGGAKN